MKLPELTGLQFAVLSLLFCGEKTVRELRREVEGLGGPRTAASFSRLMSRLQQAACVDGHRETRTVDGRMVAACGYRLTDLGLILWERTRRFYNAFDPPPPELEVVETVEAAFADCPAKVRSERVRKELAKAMEKVWEGEGKGLGDRG